MKLVSTFTISFVKNYSCFAADLMSGLSSFSLLIQTIPSISFMTVKPILHRLNPVSVLAPPNDHQPKISFVTPYSLLFFSPLDFWTATYKKHHRHKFI